MKHTMIIYLSHWLHQMWYTKILNEESEPITSQKTASLWPITYGSTRFHYFNSLLRELVKFFLTQRSPFNQIYSFCWNEETFQCKLDGTDKVVLCSLQHQTENGDCFQGCKTKKGLILRRCGTTFKRLLYDVPLSNQHYLVGQGQQKGKKCLIKFPQNSTWLGGYSSDSSHTCSAPDPTWWGYIQTPTRHLLSTYFAQSLTPPGDGNIHQSNV